LAVWDGGGASSGLIRGRFSARLRMVSGWLADGQRMVSGWSADGQRMVSGWSASGADGSLLVKDRVAAGVSQN